MTVTANGIRRQTVTVWFVDIVGFTALVDEMDCADVRALQMDYFRAVSAVVRDQGGVVEKYVGDAVMAVFGLSPGDPGEGAAAAVRAGLRVQEVLRGRHLAGRFPVSTRVGVATGDVIVDLDTAHDGGQAMISGSVVSTAARLQAYAPHDTVVVCSATRAASDSAIAYQELPPVAVPGKAQPVELSRALHPQDARTVALC
ncbi:adenylate/guanylate cyclase domain-containing protein [Jidongwangia harbinensis]|uniref:adenylate/guanylate cyclase domain-containing protein n=1 Tax=Jidongwangia harbinensis TaxID=2878561 RepID=UPI001CD9BD4F|nr:adenylate/guanylate cyclase domain-containing protein [Jidongwangia harbinensis]MCA2214880.1 adenylate/guanylate cyclase domain-containing protein [Jidongwangia harbinensis]